MKHDWHERCLMMFAYYVPAHTLAAPIDSAGYTPRDNVSKLLRGLLPLLPKRWRACSVRTG